MCHGREKREHGWLESERKRSTHQDIIWNVLSTSYTPDDPHPTCRAPGSRFRCSLHGGSLQSHHHHIMSAFGWETATFSCPHADFESDALTPFLLLLPDGFIRLLQQSWSTDCRDISRYSGVRIRIRPVDACPCRAARAEMLRALRTASLGQRSPRRVAHAPRTHRGRATIQHASHLDRTHWDVRPACPLHICL